MTEYALQEIIAAKKEINGIPVIANANFGHVHPFVTVPVGSKAVMKVKNGKAMIQIHP